MACFSPDSGMQNSEPRNSSSFCCICLLSSYGVMAASAALGLGGNHGKLMLCKSLTGHICSKVLMVDILKFG